MHTVFEIQCRGLSEMLLWFWQSSIQSCLWVWSISHYASHWLPSIMLLYKQIERSKVTTACRWNSTKGDFLTSFKSHKKISKSSTDNYSYEGQRDIESESMTDLLLYCMYACFWISMLCTGVQKTSLVISLWLSPLPSDSLILKSFHAAATRSELWLLARCDCVY